MQVIFYKARYGNLADKLIAWWTSSTKDKFNGKWLGSYSHVELLFDDGVMFSASQYDNAVRFKKYHPSNRWEQVDISGGSEDLIIKFCESIEGGAYDWWGIAGFIAPVNDSLDKWFCSEVCTQALIVGRYIDYVDSAKISPNKLYRMLKDG